jgi:hypothetical protein
MIWTNSKVHYHHVPVLLGPAAVSSELQYSLLSRVKNTLREKEKCEKRKVIV